MQTQDNLIEVQKQLEEQALQRGIERYHEMRKRGEADLAPGQRLVKRAMARMVDALKDYIKDCEAGIPGRAAGVYYFIQQWQNEPELVAYVTCRAVIDSIAINVPVQRVAGSIGRALEDQIDHEALRKLDPRAYRLLLKKIEKSSSPGYRHTVLRVQQRYVGIKAHKWGVAERTRLGMLLIEMLQQSTRDMFKVEPLYTARPVKGSKGSARGSPLYIVPTEETSQWLASAHSRCEFLSPHYMPMVTLPRPWTSTTGGGYLTKRMRFPLIKGVSRNTLEEMKAHDMPLVYKAINAMQETAWRVNAPLLRILRECWDGGGNLGGLPPVSDLPVPAKNFTDQEANEKAPAFKEWKIAAAETYQKNVALRSKRVQTNCKLHVAEQMSAYEHFHFVHALDFRGRAYAVGSFLNPQGDDAAKALLQFADGKPLGENGAFWLAVHGANCFGVDKVSFEERTKWVEEHTAEIIESADNPLDGSRFWTQADNPWQFLAFCIEWRNLDLHTRFRDTAESFVSHLPVGMDGACNGLQNFSAMLRDEVGGKATNLVPCDKPSDIYAQVAAEANAIITSDAAAGNEVAQRWVNKVTRKLTKRNTMTVPYAVSEFGMRDQLMQEFKKLRDEDECDITIAEAEFDDAKYLASVNYVAIGKVVVAARAAMDWLKEVAKVVATDGLPVKWSTPAGFTVVQDYREVLGEALDFTVCGKRYQLMMERHGDKLNRRKQASGISPNFVHALDAAHLQRTVCMCVDAGVTSFAMVHDSYGTHAADVQTMAHTLRAAFVEQYSADVLGAFREQMVTQLPEKLASEIPPTPCMGTLELAAVMNSDYFFA